MTTALTRAGTLSRVITSCGGMVSVTSRWSTRIILSRKGIRKRSPGPYRRAHMPHPEHHAALVLTQHRQRPPASTISATIAGDDDAITTPVICLALLAFPAAPASGIPVDRRGRLVLDRGAVRQVLRRIGRRVPQVPGERQAAAAPRPGCSRQHQHDRCTEWLATRVASGKITPNAVTQQAIPRWNRPASECGQGSMSRLISRP